jgi:large subunit ribosomal protein L9
MKLLLKKDVKDLGRSGDVVKVRDGYGRNFLVPQQIAIEVTEGNLRAIENEKKRLKAIEAEKISGLKTVAEKIGGVQITVAALVSEGESLYGAITAKEMLEGLKAAGVTEVELDMIQPAKPVKTLGEHTVAVRLHSQVVAELKVVVVEKSEE